MQTNKTNSYDTIRTLRSNIMSSYEWFEAYNELDRNKALRHRLLRLPVDCNYYVKTNYVMDIFLPDVDVSNVSNMKHVYSGQQKTVINRLVHMLSDENVANFIASKYPNTIHSGIVKSPQFHRSLLDEIPFENCDPINELYIRLDSIHDYIKENYNNDVIKNWGKLGSRWRLTAKIDSWKVCKDISYEFSHELNTKLNSQTLDSLADLRIPGHLLPEKKKSEKNQQIVDSHKLFIDDDNKHLGGVVHIMNDQALSSNWGDYEREILVEQPRYFREPGLSMKKGSDRLFSFEMSHSKRGEKSFLHYSEEKPVLIQSTPMSQYGYHQLEICNSLLGLHDDYVRKMVARKHGEKLIDEIVPTTHRFDSIVRTINSPFDWHTDSKCFLTDSDSREWSSAAMQVITMVFTNVNMLGAYKLEYRRKHDKKEIISIKLPPVSIVFCTWGCQDGIEHRVVEDKSITSINPSPVRFVSTFRCTRPLQQKGKTTFLNKYSDVRQFTVMGIEPEYKFYMKYNDWEEPRQQQQLGFCILDGKNDTDLIESNEQPRILRRDLVDKENEKKNKLKRVYPFKPKVYETRKKGSGQGIICLQDSHSVDIGSSISEFFLKNEVREELINNSTIVHLWHPGSKGGYLVTTHGPIFDFANNRFLKIGSIYKKDFVCEKFGLHICSSGSSIWRTRSSELNVVMLCAHYKSQLGYLEMATGCECDEMTLEDLLKNENLKSPIIDCLLALMNLPQRGFVTFGSGGNPTNVGASCATGSSATTGASFISGDDQSMSKNAWNNALIDKFNKGGSISVWLAGAFIQTIISLVSRIPELSHIRIKNDDAIYLGTYKPVKNPCYGKSLPQVVKKEVTFYNRIFMTDVKEEHLIFRTYYHYQFQLEKDDEYDSMAITTEVEKITHIHVRVDDPRRLVVQVPNGETFPQVFALDSIYRSTFEPQNVARNLFEQKIHQTSFKSIVTPLKKRKINGYMVDDNLVDGGKYNNYTKSAGKYNSIFDQVDRTVVSVPIDECVNQSKMVVNRLPRKCTLDLLWNILTHMSVSNAARYMKLNVDSVEKIGALLDSTKGQEVECQLNNYHTFFGKDKDTEYFSNLLIPARLVVFPCVIRDYDTRVAYFRQWAVTALPYKYKLFQNEDEEYLTMKTLFVCALLIEFTGKVTHLNEWSQNCTEGKRLLPKLDELTGFIDYIQSSTDDGYKNTFQHGQYTQYQCIETVEGLRDVMSRYIKHLPDFLETIAKKINKRQFIMEQHGLLLMKCGINNFQTCVWQSHHVLANIESVISYDNPFGPVSSIPVGYGGIQGSKILEVPLHMYEEKIVHVERNLKYVTNDKVFNYVLDDLVQQYHTKLALIGVKISATEVKRKCLRLFDSNKLITVTHVEHFLCKLFLWYERIPGGTRCKSQFPRQTRDHCHPVPGFDFNNLEEPFRNIMMIFKDLSEMNLFPLPMHNEKLGNSDDCLAQLCESRSHMIPSYVDYLQSPKILVLCAVYSSLGVRRDTILTDTMGRLGDRFRRDLFRCIATEEISKVKVYTMDRLGDSNDSYPRGDRHFCNDINQIRRIDFKGMTFKEVILDYYWTQEGYYDRTISSSFFSETIVIIHDILEEGGKLILPAQKVFLAGLFSSKDKWNGLYNIRVINSGSMVEIPLYRGTSMLDNEIEKSGTTIYGTKEPHQEKNITLNRNLLENHNDLRYLKEDLIRFWQDLTNGENEDDVKMIELVKK